MKGQAYINNIDIWEAYGAMLQRGSYEALLTPPAAKDYITSDSRNENGKRYVINNGVKVKEREIAISVIVEGETEEDYLYKYEQFINAITQGVFELKVPKLHRIYRLVYSTCSKYGDYGLKRGIFALRLIEPNPNDRPIV